MDFKDEDEINMLAIVFGVLMAVYMAGCGSVSPTNLSGEAGSVGTSSAGEQGGSAGSTGVAGMEAGTAGASVGVGRINFTVWTNAMTNMSTGVPSLTGQMRICVYSNDLYGAFPFASNSECASKYGLSSSEPIPHSLVVAQWNSGASTYDMRTNYRTKATAYTQSIEVPVSTTGDYLVVIYQGNQECGDADPPGTPPGTHIMPPGVHISQGVPWRSTIFAGGRVGVPRAGTVIEMSSEMFLWNVTNTPAAPNGSPGLWDHWSPCKAL